MSFDFAALKKSPRATRFALTALATLGAATVAAACGSSNSGTEQSSSGSSSGFGSGSGASSGASGSTFGSGLFAGSGLSVGSGASAGAASGSTTSSGAATGAESGATSGSASGAASGSASGAASGVDDSGSEPDAGECSAACTIGTACPTQSCYVPSANPTPASGLDGIPDNKLLPPYAIDGNLETRFSTGTPGVGVEWFQVDLCRTVYINGVNLNDSVDTTDQAAAYTIEVSLDGSTWTEVASSPDAATIPSDLTVSFDPVLARFVRFNQTGILAAGSWWSIDEFSVACGAPADAGTDAGSDAGSDAGTDTGTDAATPDASSGSETDAAGDTSTDSGDATVGTSSGADADTDSGDATTN